jgi:micrococcal nuclease
LNSKSASPFNSKIPHRRIPVFLSTLLVAVTSLSVASCAVATSRPSSATVRRVIDGDTIELSDGQLVRYIGVDTPEVRRQHHGQWIRDPEPFGEEAAEENRRLAEGRRVRLEYDAQTHDRYGRLLAYVYVAEDAEGAAAGAGRGALMVNAELLRRGVAQLLTIPPNVKYVEQFRAAAREARQARRGLWREQAPQTSP